MSISPPRTASDNYKVELSPFPAGDRLLISCIVSDLGDYVKLTSACIQAHRSEFYTEKMLPGSKSAHTFPRGRLMEPIPLREAYHSGTFQSAVIRA